MQVSILDLKKTDETRNYLLEEINRNDLISEKYKKTCKYLLSRQKLVPRTSRGCPPPNPQDVP